MNRLPHIALVLISILLVAAEQNEEELLPVPAKAAITESLTLVRDLFQEDFKGAKTNAKKIELAKKILQSGIETEDDAAGRFVLLRVARDIATDGGDLETALEAIDQLESSFKLDDALAMRVKVFDKIAPKARTAIKLREPIIELAMGLIDQTIEKDQFETAIRIRTLAYSIATKMRDFELVKQLRIKKQEIESLAKEFEGVKVALATLETKPTDPEANLTVGKYRSYIKGDWETALPMLILGSDETLKSLARADLALPETAAEQLKLGNGWWVFSEKKSSSTVKKQLKWRAAHWYEMALPELKGLSRTITEKRLASIPQRKESSSKGELKTFFLDDLPEISSQVFGVLGIHGIMGYGGKRGKSVLGKFNGQVPKHSLSAHPPKTGNSIVTYALGGRFVSLDTVAAIWDTGTKLKGPLTFKVFGDDKLLWRSGPMQKAGQWQQCKVSLKGVKTLKLQVDCPGDYAYADSVWLNPQVVGREERLVKGSVALAFQKFAKQVVVASAGYYHGNLALVYIEKKVFFGRGGHQASRGLNVVVVNKGHIMLAEKYDTSARKGTGADQFAMMVSKLPPGCFVVVAVMDDASNRFNENSQKALFALGARTGLQGTKLRSSYILIGAKGLKPGQAIEMLAPNSFIFYPQSLSTAMQKELAFLLDRNIKEVGGIALDIQKAKKREKLERKRLEALRGNKSRKELKKEKKAAKNG